MSRLVVGETSDVDRLGAGVCVSEKRSHFWAMDQRRVVQVLACFCLARRDAGPANVVGGFRGSKRDVDISALTYWGVCSWRWD